MASLKDTDGTEQESDKKKEKGTLESAEENLASIRSTLAALDGLNKRWETVQQRFADALRISLQSAFGVEAPCTLTDEEKCTVLGGTPTIEELCGRLKKGQYRKVIVMVGAGVSVAAGIPDFRSPGTGLYDNLKKYDLPSPQAIFEMDFFRQNPKPFFSLAKELYPGRVRPTSAHYFIKLLEDSGLLLRCYTQNIDTLERQAGVTEDQLVEAHGSFARARCIAFSCGKEYSAEEVKEAILSDQIPKCTTCGDVVKPCVVFFGEELPQRFKELLEEDFAQCDLLIVMGTSLQVQPFSGLIYRVSQTTPRLLINKERVGTFALASEGGYRDVALLGECNDAVGRVCDLCGWRDSLDKLVEQGRGGRDSLDKLVERGRGGRATNRHTCSKATRTVFIPENGD